MLRSQKKALEEAEKANQISLEEFLEVEVCPFFQSHPSTAHDVSHLSPLPPGPNVAPQIGTELNARDSRELRQMETDADEQEGG